VTKPNWGLKRSCQSCGARFYDLNKDEIECPKCGTVYDPEAILKTKRSKPAAAAPRPAAVVAVPEAEAELEPIEEEVVEGAEGEEKEDEVIEDTSELGEDGEDVAEVVDNVDDEER
jgi:uncharacterized protein (TIGR02300 family)